MVVTDTGFRAFVFNTVTGKITGDLPVAKVAWGERLNGPGQIQLTTLVEAKEVRNLDLRMSTQVVVQSLGISYNGVILEAGPIWMQDYDADKETLSLTASGVWSIFDVRKALKGNAPGGALDPEQWHAEAAAEGWEAPGGSVISMVNTTLGSIARELVRISIQDNPFLRIDGLNAGSLPIVLPAPVAGTRQENYNGFDLGWIGERLRQLTTRQNGPDIRFRPRFKGEDPTFVEYILETGSEAQPLLQQTGPDWLWDTSVMKSGAVKLSVKRDGTKLAARAWVPGNGQERNMLLAWQTDPTLVEAGFPWTEVDTASKQIEDMDVLQGYADRLLADSAAPWDQWSLSVRADVAPKLSDYLPGDWARIIVGPGHPIILPGEYRVRILAVDGDHTEIVKLTVAPIQGAL